MVKQVDCADCEFLIQHDDEEELIDFVKRHSENTHGMTASRADVEGWMTEV